jgi:hypothetical protein
MWQQNGNQRQGGECVFASQSGGSAGGGAEKTPAGDYSINTLLVPVSCIGFELGLPCEDEQRGTYLTEKSQKAIEDQRKDKG